MSRIRNFQLKGQSRNEMLDNFNSDEEKEFSRIIEMQAQ